MKDKTHEKTILITDDSPQVIALLHGLLQADYTILFALNGEDALQTATSRPVDLILLDVSMPGMDGFEVCRHLKKHESMNDIPIIFITASTSPDDEAIGFEAGAVDFITKPVNPAIVKARVKTHIALHSAQKTLEALNTQLLDERETIEQIIVNIQKSIPFKSTHIRCLTRPLEKVSGDLVLSEFRPDGGQHVMLGDFTGHGVAAAVGGPLIADTFHSKTALGLPLGVICEKLNLKLFQILRVGMFMAGGFLELNPDRTQLSLWNYGMHDLLIFRNNSLSEKIPSQSLPMGVRSQLDNKPKIVSVQPGDRVFIFSDGIVEERNTENNFFGMERTQDMLGQIISQNQSLEVIMDILEHFRQGRSRQDDISLVELTC